MRFLPMLLVAAIVFQAAPIQAGAMDLADYCPAGALAYVEIKNPAETGQRLAAFLAGTALENPLPILDRFREKRSPELIDASATSALALLSPETLKEFGRFQGAAFAITGFGKQGEPRYVGALLTGDSQVPGILMRGFLAGEPSIRKAATIDGIDLYQRRNVSPFENPPDAGPQPEFQFSGPLFAYRPGLVLLASDKDAAADFIHRLQGTVKTGALASTAAFKQAAAQRDANGVFIFADIRRLLERYEAELSDAKQGESFPLALLRKWLPTAGVGTLSGSLDFHEKGADLRCALKFDPAKNQPLADFLTGPALAQLDLNGPSKDALCFLTLNLPAGPSRLPRLLAALDPLIRATGTLGPSATEILHELEDRKALDDATLAKVNRITLIVPRLGEKGALPLPTVLLQADSEAAAEALAAAVPAVLELLGGLKADAITETIDGVKVRTLEARSTPLGVPIHFAQHGSRLAVGVKLRSAAQALLAETDVNAEVADAVKLMRQPALVGVWNWASMPSAPTKRIDPRSNPPVGEKSEVKTPAAGAFMPVEIAAALGVAPPLVFSLGRDKDELRLEVLQRDPERRRVKAIERWIEWLADARTQFFFDAPRRDGALELDGPLLRPFGQ